MESELKRWLNEETRRRGWSLREVARRGGSVSPVAIINVANGTNRAGTKVCRAIARAFDMPEEKILEMAGVLAPHGEVLAEVRDWSERLRELDTDRRSQAIDVMDAVLRIVEGRP